MEVQRHYSICGIRLTPLEYVLNAQGYLSCLAPSFRARAARNLPAHSLLVHNPQRPLSTHNQVRPRTDQTSQTSLWLLRSSGRPRGGLFSWVLVGVIQKGAVLALVLGLILYPDFKLRMDQRVQEIQLKGANCALDYDRNKCDISTRVPFVEQDCREWELCMIQTKVYSLSIITEMLGETISHFFDYMNWTALLFLLSVVVICPLYCLKIAK